MTAKFRYWHLLMSAASLPVAMTGLVLVLIKPLMPYAPHESAISYAPEVQYVVQEPAQFAPGGSDANQSAYAPEPYVVPPMPRESAPPASAYQDWLDRTRADDPRPMGPDYAELDLVAQDAVQNEIWKERLGSPP